MKIAVPVVLVLTLLAGLAIGAWIGPGSDRSASAVAASTAQHDGADIEERLSRLEVALNAEREARQLLEDELFAIYDALDAFDDPGGGAGIPTDRAAAADAGVRVARVSGDRRPNSRRGSETARLDALTRAGFTPARAEWILARESELRMQAMQSRYDAMRLGEPAGADAGWNRSESLLRQELGDTEFERYLDASGRPIRVRIGEVFASSPAAAAGLEPGDEITHYDGERVFGTADLVRETMHGDPGETVVVTVLRDGSPMQLVLPRGPLGVSTRWRR